MADLATLKSRIASDLRRSDLTTDIAYAIADAVAEYQGRRFAFNQTRDTFLTVAGTDFYVSGEDPEDIPDDIAELDTVSITVSGDTRPVYPASHALLERLISNTTSRGQPSAYAWYQNKLRLYPVPDAAYTITLSYLQKIDAPSSDGDSNAWTTEAETLIRACAKKILCRDVLRNQERAALAEAAEATVFRRLKREARQLETGDLQPSGI